MCADCTVVLSTAHLLQTVLLYCPLHICYRLYCCAVHCTFVRDCAVVLSTAHLLQTVLLYCPLHICYRLYCCTAHCTIVTDCTVHCLYFAVCLLRAQCAWIKHLNIVCSNNTFHSLFAVIQTTWRCHSCGAVRLANVGGAYVPPMRVMSSSAVFYVHQMTYGARDNFLTSAV